MHLFDNLLCKSKIIPVVSINDVAQAVPIARALLEGGIDIIEITLRHPSAAAGMAEIIQQKIPIIVLAGTVMSANSAQQVHGMGVRAALSPGFDPALLQYAQSIGLAFIPGVATASEVMAAHNAGCRSMKFFPAGAMGGVATLKSYAAVFPDVLFCPTGGVDIDNFKSYLDMPNVACVGGSWLTPPALVQKQEWQAITALARLAIDKM